MPDEIFYFQNSAIPETLGGNSSGIFGVIRTALKQGLRVEIEYQSETRHSKREILPEVLFRSAEDWYLAAYCFAQEAPRTFRLDRIVAAALTDIHENSQGVAKDIRENGVPWKREAPEAPATADDKADKTAPLWTKLEVVQGENGPEIRVTGSPDGKISPKIARDFSFDLVYDAERGYFERVQEDLAAGADVNFVAGDGQTPFTAAAKSGNLEILKYLVERGAKPDANRQDGATALTVAAKFSSVEVIRYLAEELKLEIDVRDCYLRTPLFYAAQNVKPDAVDYLLAHGADARIQDCEGKTLLMAAAESFSQDEEAILAVLQKLLQAGADIHAEDRQRRTALYHALKPGRFACASWLIAKGIEARHFDKQGASPLLFALQSFCDTVWLNKEAMPERERELVDAVRLLSRYGADIHAANHQGVTPLMLAHGKLLEALIDEGAFVNAFDRNGKTVAMYHAKQFDELKRLWQAGADLSVRDFAGEDILMKIPLEYGTVCDCVNEFNLAVTGQNNRGETLLHRAVAMEDSLDLIKFLVRHGADLYLSDGEGNVPADSVSLIEIYADSSRKRRHRAYAYKVRCAAAEECLQMWDSFEARIHKILHPKTKFQYPVRKTYYGYGYHDEGIVATVITTWQEEETWFSLVRKYLKNKRKQFRAWAKAKCSSSI